MSQFNPKRPFLVSVRIRPDRHFNREILRGIAAFSTQVGGWSIDAIPNHYETASRPIPDEASGILTYEPKWAELDELIAIGKPIINLTMQRRDQLTPVVSSDGVSCITLAVEHLFDQGISSVAMVASSSRDLYALCQQDARFVDLIGRRGGGLEGPFRYKSTKAITQYDEAGLLEWIRRSRKPVGVVCESDTAAAQLIDDLHEMRIRIPDEVAVVSVGNDDIVCNFTSPHLSSVAPNAVGIGYRAAELLHEILKGNVRGTPHILMQPEGLVERESTQVIATDSRPLAEAIRYVRRNACRGIGIPDILSHTNISKTTLVRGFRRELGRSPLEEIRRLQLDAIRRLLIETDLKVNEIAHRTGFSDGRYLSQVFRRAENCTPTEFREAREAGEATGYRV